MRRYSKYLGGNAVPDTLVNRRVAGKIVAVGGRINIRIKMKKSKDERKKNLKKIINIRIKKGK